LPFIAANGRSILVLFNPVCGDQINESTADLKTVGICVAPSKQ
jgi:hypothetical protein